MSKTVRSTPSPQAGGVVVRTPAEGVQATVGDRKLELTDQTFYLPRRKIITIFLTCSATETVALLDEKCLAVALSIISSELNAGSKISWVASGYFLTSTSCQLLYGRISDIWSRKTILLCLIGIFFFGSLASSLAQSLTQLVVFRALTGIGGGGLILMGQVIVSDVVTLRERGRYQGILGAFVALSNGIGPLIGGALSEKASWRWIFRMNMPLAVFSAIFVWFFMPLKKVEGDWKAKLRKVDFLGALLTLSGTTLTVLALTWAGSEYAWNTPQVIACLVAGISLFACFVIWEWKGAQLPLLPVYIFRNRVVIGSCFTMCVNGFGMYVQIFYLPAFYQLVYGYSAIKSGAMLLSVVLFQTLTSTASGALVTWRGRYREILLSGWITWSIALGLFATLDENSSLARQIGFSVLAGFGIGQTLQPSLVATQAAVERSDMAVVTSARSFVHNLGGTLGLAISGTLINNVLRRHLGSLPLTSDALSAIINNPVASSRTLDPATAKVVVEGYRRGFRTVFIVCSSLAAAAFVVTLLLMPQKTLRRADDEERKVEARKYLEERKTEKAQNGKQGSGEVDGE